MLDGACIYLPAHDLELSVGDNPIEHQEAEMLVEGWQDLIEESGTHPIAALQNRPQPDPRERSRYWPVFVNGSNLAGALILSRAANMAKLGDRSCNTASFVASTIEHLLEKVLRPGDRSQHLAAFRAGAREST